MGKLEEHAARRRRDTLEMAAAADAAREGERAAEVAVAVLRAALAYDDAEYARGAAELHAVAVVQSVQRGRFSRALVGR